MRTCKNYEVKIWLGHRYGYGDIFAQPFEIDKVIQEWCNEKKQCVSVTDTKFIYVDGNEPGIIIGFINYPRFPYEKQEILDRALELGEILRTKFGQYRVSVSTPEMTYLLEDEEK